MKARLKSKLASDYNISMNLLRSWMSEVKDLNLKPHQKVLSPKQILKIYEVWGTPDKM